MGNLLIFSGIFLLLVGIISKFFTGVHIPLLPGDIVIPIVTSILISILLTIIINFFRK